MFLWCRRHAYFARQVQIETEALNAIAPDDPPNARVARLMQDWSRKAERDLRKGKGRPETKPRSKDRFTLPARGEMK